MDRNSIVILVIVVTMLLGLYTCRSIEPFDDFAQIERQQRAGKMTLADHLTRDEFNRQFKPLHTYFTEFQRFHIELFAEKDFQNKVTALKDATEQFLSVSINKPIRSIRIRVVPNDNWRFAQFFSLVIYLKHDPTKRVIFHSPDGAESLQYEISDTTDRREALEWLNNYDSKVAYFTTNIYDPLPDLYDPDSRLKQSIVAPRIPLTQSSLLQNVKAPKDNVISLKIPFLSV